MSILSCVLKQSLYKELKGNTEVNITQFSISNIWKKGET